MPSQAAVWGGDGGRSLGQRRVDDGVLSTAGCPRAKGGPCCVPCTPALAPAIFCFARATGVTTNSTLLLAHALFSFLCLQMCIFLSCIWEKHRAVLMKGNADS